MHLDTVIQLTAQDIKYCLVEKLNSDKIAEHYSNLDYKFAGNVLKLTSRDSLYFEIPTLKTAYPELYKKDNYNLLITFCLCEERDFKDNLMTDVGKLLRRDRIDKFIVWTKHKLPNTKIQLLKTYGIDTMYIDELDILKHKSIISFLQIPDKQIDYLISLNLVTDLLIKRLKKLFHLILSEIAAPIYEKYSKAKAATTAIMEFENEILRPYIEKLKSESKNKIAVDVGCGTGRHSFHISKFFESIYAFDFSPNMIKIANDLKDAKVPVAESDSKEKPDYKNISFSVGDLEHEEISDESDFFGKTNLILSSFGMGSFIEDTSRMLRKFHNWMSNDSYLFLSFYNSNSVLLKIEPNWRDTSLSAHIEPNTNTLKVSLPGSKSTFDIYCKTFSNEVKYEINKLFKIEKIYTFPSIMALMPNSIFSNDLAKDLFKHVDKLISDDENFQYGHYVLVIAKKVKLDSVVIVKEKPLEILESSEIDYEIINHNPVISIKDVLKQFPQIDTRVMIKTIILRNGRKKLNFQENNYVIIVLPSNKLIDENKLATELNTTKRKLEFANDDEIFHLGFPVGGIAPFGFSQTQGIIYFVDKDLFDIDSEWFYMGVGNNSKTLKMKKVDFERIVGNYKRI